MADPLTDAIGAEFSTPLKKISTGAGIDPNDPAQGRGVIGPSTSESGIPTDVKAGAEALGGGASASGVPAPVAQGAAALGGGTMPTSPVGAGTNSGVVSPTAASGNIDPNVAMNQVSTTFQSALGRPITPQEQQQLIGALGLQPGQPITQAHIDQAGQLIKQYAATQPGAAPAVPGNVSEPAPLAAGAGPTPATPQTATPLAPGTGPASPTNPGPIGPTPGAPIDPNTAMNTVSTAFQSALGRPMTPAEQQQLISAVGLQPGQPITQAHLDQAQQLIKQYATSQGGATPGAPGSPAAPGAPAGGIDPNKAMSDISAQFLQKFGRAPSAEEQAWLTKMSGYTSGLVTPEQMAAAVDAMGRYTGDVKNPIKVEKPKSPEELAASTRLQELLGESWGEVDETSKGFAGQKQANALAQQRSTDRKRAALAERAAARGGLQAGGFDVDQERLIQEQGQQEQAFESKLYSDELNQQRDRLLDGIKLAKESGLAEDAQALQQRLGELDIKLRESLGKGQLGLGLLNSNRQNQQFADSLGLSLAQLENLMNTTAIQQMFA